MEPLEESLTSADDRNRAKFDSIQTHYNFRVSLPHERDNDIFVPVTMQVVLPATEISEPDSAAQTYSSPSDFLPVKPLKMEETYESKAELR